MAKIRIGNDIAVTWTLKDGEGNPYDLRGRDVEVHLRSFYVDEQMEFEATGADGNIASFTFYGKDQGAPGKYNLLLIENKGEVAQVMFDVKDVFELVKHSWETDDESAEGITTESVQIVSTVSDGIIGPQGPAGNGIASAVLNADYTLTLHFTDGTSYTTPSIRGAQGPAGSDADVTYANVIAALGFTPASSSELAGKQDTLVSGTNIKTINDQSILGEGNIVIQGGGGSDDAVRYTEQSLTDAQKQQALANIEATHYLTVGGKKIWSGSEDAYEALIPRDDTLYFVGPPDYSQKYLTFKAREAGTFSFEHYGDGGTIEYSLDGGTTWDELNEGDDTPTVAAGAEILWRCSDYDLSGESGMVNFKATGALDIYGNIMSLLYGDDFVGQTAMPEYGYAFDYIFDSMPVVEARNLILPAMTLYEGCYEGMFCDCADLISAPKLPATVMAAECYYDMFDGCESLVNIPDISHITTLAEYCFGSMFENTAITTAPALPWVQLEYGCYADMFHHCANLVNAPELPATTLAEKCYSHMFAECTSLVTAPELPATTLAEGCYISMFAECTSLVTVPELSATTLAEKCYWSMFEGCTSLINAPELPATILAKCCYSGMFARCTSLINAPELPVTTLAEGCYGDRDGNAINRGMFEGCTSLITAPELPATTLAKNCYSGMFKDCTSLVTAPELSATTLAEGCYISMFAGCTSLVSAPELPAATLLQYCYREMFKGCSLLNYIKCLATNKSAFQCTNDWVVNVASSGTFIKAAGQQWSTGVYGIPTGWTVQEAS